jgi:hypothetical protein
MNHYTVLDAYPQIDNTILDADFIFGIQDGMHRLSEVSLKDHTSPNKRLKCSIFLNLSQALKQIPHPFP